MPIRGLFQSHADTWTRSIRETAAGERPLRVDGSANHLFPWVYLRKCTDAYLRKKGNNVNQNERDARLSALIISFPQKDVAVAACAYFMTIPSLTALLHTELQQHFDVHSGQDGLTEYLSAIWAVGISNSGFDQEEGALAAALVPYATGSILVFDQLAGLLNLMSRHGHQTSILANTISTMASSTCLLFDQRLRQLYQTGQWCQAADCTAWLRTLATVLPHSPNATAIQHLLDRDLTSWSSWAAWIPDRARLSLWQQGLDQAQLDQLAHILAWEGPDLQPYPLTNLKERMIATAYSEARQGCPPAVDAVVFNPPLPKERLRAWIDAVLTCIDQISQDSTSNSLINKVAGILLSTPLERGNVEILNLLIAANNATITRAVYELYQTKPDTSHIVAALPLFDETSLFALSLRSRLGARVVRSLETRLADLQAEALRHVSAVTATTYSTIVSSVQQLSLFALSIKDISWSAMYMYPPVMELLRTWPTHAIESFLSLFQYARFESAKPPSSAMQDRLRMYFIRLCVQRSLGVEEVRTILALVPLFDPESGAKKFSDYKKRRALAYSLVDDIGPEEQPGYAITCLKHLVIASEELVSSLSDILTNFEKDDEQAHLEGVLALAEHLAMERDPKVVCCWRVLLFRMMERHGGDFVEDRLYQDVVNFAGIRGFTQFIEDLGEIYLRPADKWHGVDDHPLLNRSLNSWITKTVASKIDALSEYAETVNDAGKTALYCLVIAAGKPYAGQLSSRISDILNNMDKIAKWSAKYEDRNLRKNVMYQVLNLLKKEGSNAHLVSFMITTLANRIDRVSTAMLHTCNYIMDCLDEPEYSDIRHELCEVLIAGSLHPHDGMNSEDRRALLEFGCLLDVRLMDPGFISSSNKVMSRSVQSSTHSFEAVREVLDEQAKEIYKQAEYLESLRLAFKLQDPDGISRLFEGLGVEDESPLRRMMKKLPSDLLDVIELVDDAEVEIQIPLTGLSTFQLTAMGHTSARNVLVRLYFDTSGQASFRGFCVHFDDESSDSIPTTTAAHKPHMIDPRAPLAEIAQCHGRLSPMVYQISRLLADHFTKGFTDLAKVHGTIKKIISSKTMFSGCLVCNKPHKGTQSPSAAVAGPSSLNPWTAIMMPINNTNSASIRFFRPSICHLASCKDALFKSAPEVSLAIMQQDPAAAVLILAAVYAVTISSVQEQVFALLPACPSTTVESLKATLQNLLRVIPATSGLSSTSRVDLRHHAIHGPGSEINAAFLRWALAGSTYKGYLVSATGQLRLPGLAPGIQQFAQVHADPEQEMAFAMTLKMHKNESSVKFHGTTLDRLFAILVQGLKSQSGTAFQRNGVSYGKGIYLADEMTTAFGYSNTSAASAVGVPWPGAGGRFGTAIRVMLGVELAGASTAATTGIHVITDAARVIVRYVFICGPGTAWPVARHVAPAMQSVFNSLRTGDI